MSTILQKAKQTVGREQLLEMAKELDRFSRRFERFCVVQLEQLDLATKRLQREQEQWKRQRDRDMRQIAENRRALERARDELKSGTAESASVDLPELPGLPESLNRTAVLAGPVQSSAAPLNLLIRLADDDEMLIGRLLLAISRLNRGFGGTGTRFEISESYVAKNQVILEIDAFSRQPLVMMTRGDVSSDVENWAKFKSAVALLPLGRGLDEAVDGAESAPRDHEAAVRFSSAARRAEDGDERTAGSVRPGRDAVDQYSEELVDLIEQYQAQLSLQVVVR